MVILIRQLLVASLLSLALISLFGSLTPKAGPLDYCKADAARLCRLAADEGDPGERLIAGGLARVPLAGW